jgi:cytochrome bd-type quinol oxidase subunit 2
MDLPKEMLMGLMFIVGLVLTIFAFKIANDVNICKVSAAQNALRGLLVMGVMLMSITGTTLGINCNTGKSDSETSVNGMIFVILMLVIGIITTALVSVIHKNCEDARKDTPILLTMSVLIMVVSGGYLGYTGYNHHISTNIKSKFSFGG